MKSRSTAAVFLQVALTVFGTLGIAVITPFSEAIAQKGGGTTLVKNVDEPGRVPYQAYAEFTPAGCNTASDCANFNYDGYNTMLFDAPVVPAGKRLVIMWVSATVPNGSNNAELSLQSSQAFANQNTRWQFHGPWGNSGRGMSSGAFVVYGPGERPHVRVSVWSLSGCCVGSVNINGYLIDAN